MDCSIKLIVGENNASREIARDWYQAVKSALPSGVLTTVQIGDRTAALTTKKDGGNVAFCLPLLRELTANEVEAAIRAFDERTDIDFKVEATQTRVEVNPEINVEVDESPLLELCTAWAKKKHDDWVKAKTDAGWRYGSTVSKKEQTHPLLRQWSDLPEQYRKVDTEQAEALLKLFNDSGYVMVRKEDLNLKRG